MKFLSYVAALFSLIFERKLYRMHLRINDEHIRGRIMTVCVGSALGLGTDSECRTLQRLAGCIRHLPSGIPANHFGIVDADSGRILNHKMVKSYRTRKVKVLRAQNASVDLDGRLLARHFPLEIGVLSEKTTLIIPN